MSAPEPGRADAAVRFLLSCLAARRQPERLLAARELGRSGEVDWEACQALAEVEKVEPLLFSIVAGQQIVPRQVEARWREAYRRSAVRSALLFRELAVVTRALLDVEVASILLKGAALALTVYVDPSLRPMTDLDLLVRREDVPRALQALQAAGYTMSLPELGLTGALQYTNEFLLSRPGPLEIPVEIHWGLFDSPFYSDRASEARLWEGSVPSRPVEGTSQPARILRPEAQVLHLCGHLALHHGGEGLLWLNDIAEVIYHSRGQIDWHMLLGQAQAARLVLPLQQILPRVVDDWHAPVPEDFPDQLRALQPSPEEAKVYARMKAGPGPVASEVWAKLGGLDAAGRRLRFLLAKLFPAPAYMRQRYEPGHAALLPLTYPYRWLLGARSAASVLTRSRSRKR